MIIVVINLLPPKENDLKDNIPIVSPLLSSLEPS